MACGVAAVMLYLAGCTASWRAPVEGRGGTHRSTSPAPPPRTATRPGEYRVQRGDTLYGIAWQNGVDFRLVAAWNGIRPPYHIYPGQVLRLAAPPALRTPPPQPPPTAKPRPRPSPPPKTVAPPSSARLAWAWPADGQIITTFKSGDPLRNGIKIGGRNGNVIRAAEGGKVVYSGSGLIGYGRLIIVKHNDNYLSAYGHNRTILVKEGDRVTKGQKIAEMGAANDGKPQLHFEVRFDGKPVDPLRVLPRR